MSRSLSFVPRLSLVPVSTEPERENLETGRVSESTENEVRVLSAEFGVLEKMTKMAQNVYTFYEEVKKKN